MFRRGLLILFSLLVTLGFFANSYAHEPVEPPAAPLTIFPGVVVVIKSANVRSGPGTDFPVISAARPGQRLTVLGCNADCSWYQLANDCWIAAFLVKPEQPAAPPIATGGAVLPTTDARLPTVVVNIPITVTGGVIQTTRCPQTLAAVNTYAGPGTFFAVIEAIPAGECVAIVGRNTIGDWFQLSHGMWILAAAVIYAEPLATIPVTDRFFTATPEPPPTPSTPILTAEEQEYLGFINAQAQIYTLTWSTLEAQATLLAQNPLLISTNDWRSLTSSTLLLIRVANENVRTRIPPARFASAHTTLVNAANQYDQAISLVTAGLDNSDVNQLVAAQASMVTAYGAIQSAISAIEGLRLEPLAAQTVVAATETPTPLSSTQGCDPNYEGACVPLSSSDLNCPQIAATNFRSVGSDPHDLDGNNDGIACEED